MVLEKTKFSISKKLGKFILAVQKRKKNSAEIFGIFECLLPQTHLIKTLNSLDSSRQNRRLSQNPKTGCFRELFLPKIDFKTCFKVNFPKIHPDLGGLETNRKHEIQT